MRNKKRAFYKNKTVIAAGILSLLAVCGLAGVYRMETLKNKADQELVNWEETEPDMQEARDEDSLLEAKEETPELVDKDVADGQEGRLQEGNDVNTVPKASVEPADVDSDTMTDSMQGTDSNSPDQTQLEGEHADAGGIQDETAEASVQNAINLNFQPEVGMLWPVEGNVVLDYSMNQSIYFPTLDQYKYNPAIAIQSETGTPVVAAATGVIESIVETDETGITMTVDIGNGYKAVYGQLANVTLSTGSYVEAGSQIATVAEPSIYYQVEGDNLYFQVLKDGVPTDPLDYIK